MLVNNVVSCSGRFSKFMSKSRLSILYELLPSLQVMLKSSRSAKRTHGNWHIDKKNRVFIWFSDAELPGKARRERLPVDLACAPVAVAVAERSQRIYDTAAASTTHRAMARSEVAVSTCVLREQHPAVVLGREQFSVTPRKLGRKSTTANTTHVGRGTCGRSVQ